MKVKELYEKKNNGLFGAIGTVLNQTWYTSDFAKWLNFDYFKVYSALKEVYDDTLLQQDGENVFDADGYQVYDGSGNIIVYMDDSLSRFENIANIIVSRYGSKWITTYNTFIESYDPSELESFTEKESPDIIRTKNGNVSQQGNNSLTSSSDLVHGLKTSKTTSGSLKTENNLTDTITHNTSNDVVGSSTNTVNGTTSDIGKVTNGGTLKTDSSNTSDTSTSVNQTSTSTMNNQVYGFGSVDVPIDQTRTTDHRTLTGAKTDNATGVTGSGTQTVTDTRTVDSTLDRTTESTTTISNTTGTKITGTETTAKTGNITTTDSGTDAVDYSGTDRTTSENIGSSSETETHSDTERESGTRERTYKRTGGDYVKRASDYLTFRQNILAVMIMQDVDKVLTIPLYL